MPPASRVLLFLSIAIALLPRTVHAQTLPAGFHQTAVFTGLTQPTAVKFARDGRVFVAEKSGLIKVFDNLSDTTPTVFADLRTNVHNFWDRGLLGLELHPDFPTTPYVYVLYSLDAPIGGVAPRWGVAGMTTDPCPTPPGANADGCVIGARLSRLRASGNTATGPENVLLEDWCQQYPSHSIGSLAFGSDGALYVTGGDGASYNFVDYGQDGSPLNPCADPPAGEGGTQTPPSAEGGSLRSQDREVTGDPTGFGGTVLRIDPITGEALPNNPLTGGAWADDDRIIAYGLRNPFRITIRPGTNEIWIGDVGSAYWEEINRIVSPTDGSVRNFGWPCYEGAGHQSGFDAANLNICEALYAGAGFTAVTPPFYAYRHSEQVVANETCPTGGSSLSGLAFYGQGTYPAQYRGALFFADYSRNCIWAMLPGASGLPDRNQRLTFIAGASNPVQLTIGPSGDLFYVDLTGGRIIRVQYKAPTAVATATPSSGSAPLAVSFSSAGSSDPDDSPLSYAWDLDDDGVFDDGSQATAAYTYVAPGNHTARLRVTDSDGLSDTASITLSVSNSGPTATITQPSSTLTWRVGDVISFNGTATDPQDGPLPASAMTWTLTMQHCPSTCHQHEIQEFEGVANGQFVAPDHEYPSYLELRLTVRDSWGATGTKVVTLQPRTVDLTFETAPAGLRIAVGPSTAVAPFTRRVIVGSNNSLSVAAPQSLGATSYTFSSWSDGGAQTHNIVAPSTATTYRAVLVPGTAPSLSVGNRTITEGTGQPTTVLFTVRLSAATGKTVSVHYATFDKSAKAGIDYSAAAGTLTFGPGVTSMTVPVSVIADSMDEPDESVGFGLSNAVNATIKVVSVVGIVLDDDAAPTLTIANATVTEADTTKNAVFTVSLSAASGKLVTVAYQTSSGSAISGTDFVSTAGTLTFARGTRTATIKVPIVGDNVREAAETFTLQLSSPQNATIADGVAVGTINDDDGLP